MAENVSQEQVVLSNDIDLLQKQVKELREENAKLKTSLESRELIMNRILDVIDDMSVCQDFDEDKSEQMLYVKTLSVSLSSTLGYVVDLSLYCVSIAKYNQFSTLRETSPRY